jgi:hypothetical protein
MPASAASWLLPRDHDKGGANWVRLTLWKQRIGEADRTAAYCTNVPEDEFYRYLHRASRHKGYSARQHRLAVYHQGPLVLERHLDPRPTEQQGIGQRAATLRTWRHSLVSWDELPGAPILACRYKRDEVPFSTFSCGQRPDSVCQVTRLRLRVHRRAELVFEVSVNEKMDVVRTVHIEVDVPPEQDDELLRTVENTAHIVLLGARPHAAFNHRLRDGARAG